MIAPKRIVKVIASIAIGFLIFSCVWYVLQPEVDLLVLDATIIDGLGGKPFHSDVGIKDGRIVYIGSVGRLIGFIQRTVAYRVINAHGLTLAPGFIDVHTHVEGNILPDRPFRASNFVHQGVTTIITGNCGKSFANIAELFSQLSRNGSQINVASLVGHNSIRSAVMSEYPNRFAEPYEIEQMMTLVEFAMQSGALGFSTGLGYQPGCFASTEEIVELTKVASRYKGIYSSHVRDEGIRGMEALVEVMAVSRRADIPLQISHFKAAGRSQWGTAKLRLALIESARVKGAKITIDQYPYLSSSTSLDVLLPPNELVAAFNKKLRDKTSRERLRIELVHKLRENGWEDFSYAKIANYNIDSSFNGLSIPEALRISTLSQQRGDLIRDDAAYKQADFILQLLSKGGAQMIYDEMNEEDMLNILRNKYTMFGSDSAVRTLGVGMPHPRGYGTFPRVLSLCREKRILAMEEAIRRMTSLPATTFGISERGLIKRGYWADLVLFDQSKITDIATYKSPFEFPSGIRYVIISGTIVLDDNLENPVYPGKVIRKSLPN